MASAFPGMDPYLEDPAYRWSIRRRLPVLPIPLKSGDADVQVNLQQALDEAFERGDYLGMIDYSSALPRPKFSGEDAEWVTQRALVAAK